MPYVPVGIKEDKKKRKIHEAEHQKTASLDISYKHSPFPFPPKVQFIKFSSINFIKESIESQFALTINDYVGAFFISNKNGSMMLPDQKAH